MIAESVFKDLKNWRRVPGRRRVRRLEISPGFSMEIHTYFSAKAPDEVPTQQIVWERQRLPEITESADQLTAGVRRELGFTDWMPLRDEVALSIAWRYLKELTGGFKMEEKEVKTPAGVFKCAPVEWIGGDNYVLVATHNYPGTEFSVTAGLCDFGSGNGYGPAFLRIDNGGGNFEFNAFDRGVEITATGELEIDDLIKGLEFALTTLRDMRESRS